MPDLRDDRKHTGITVKKGKNCASCCLSIFIGSEDELACVVHKCSVGPGRNACKSFIEYKSAKQAKEEQKKWKMK